MMSELLRSRTFWLGAAAGAGVATAVGAVAWAVSNFEWVACKLFLGVDIGKMLAGDTREEMLLAHIFATAKRGDAASVLAAVDSFCDTQGFMMHIGSEKASILRRILQEAEKDKKTTQENGVERILDIGTYCGYSAIVLATAIPGASPKVTSVEFNPTLAAISRAIIDFAGLSSQITVVVSSAADAIRTRSGDESKEWGRGSVDVVLMDHWERLYVEDAKRLEGSGLLRPGGILLADNVLSHGAGALLLEYLKTGGDQKDEGSKKKWDLELVECHLQYSKTKDAIAIAKAR
jgi:catechol O-methyltransferase